MPTEYEKAKDVYDRQVQFEATAKQSLNGARNRLYIASLTTIVVFSTNAIPTRIDALGIDFSGFGAHTILPILSIASLYFFILFVARDRQYGSTRKSLKLAHDQVVREAGMLTPQEWRKAQHEGHLTFLIGDASGVVAAIIQTITPLAVGLLASLVGLFPSSFEWVQSLLMEPASK